jgi:hypothetical protein
MPMLMHPIIAAMKQINAVLKYPCKLGVVDDGIQNGEYPECLSP